MRILSLLLLLCTFNAYAQAPQVQTLKPCCIHKVPDIDLVESDNYTEKSSWMDILENKDCYNAVYIHFSGGCSWYCGGGIDTVTASSSLSEKYCAENAHDWDITTAWVEGRQGNGEYEYLSYSFPGGGPRVTTVYILNGYTKTKKAWRNNGRVKKLLMYYNDKPYAILHLKDTRDCQEFEVGILGDRRSKAHDWSIKFQILEVYPGDKYQDTAITELYFDGLDVH